MLYVPEVRWAEVVHDSVGEKESDVLCGTGQHGENLRSGFYCGSI